MLQKGEEFDIWPILPKLDRGFKNHQQISEGSEVAYDFKIGRETFKIGIEMSLFDSTQTI